MNSTDADLMSIGRHCSLDACGQVDFLPFVCDCCSKVYCLDHRTYAAHSCTKSGNKTTEVIVCPLCAKSVRMTAGEDSNAAFHRHSITDCDPSNYAKVHKKPKCPAQGCKEKLTSINTYQCKTCAIKVCLKHRLADDHGCSGSRGAVLAAAASRQKGSAAASTTSSMIPDWFSSKRGTATAATGVTRPQDPTNTVKGSVYWRQMQPSTQPGRTAAGGSSGPELCQQCGARFGTIAQLIQHSEEYHAGQQPGASEGTGGGDFRCTKCGQSFRDAVALVAHDERQHSTAAARSDCVVC